jgi:multicomponent Na+:H+ antiporter subunit F
MTALLVAVLPGLGVLAGLLGLGDVPLGLAADVVANEDTGSDWYGPLPVHDVAMVVLGLAMVLAVVRLVRGPTLADRVVALDLLAFFAAGIVAIGAVLSERSELLMVAVVVALLTFMGTAAFALYLERRGREDAS